jgi:hypothetical protein
VCTLDESGVRTVFFAETTGVAPQFAIEGETAVRRASPGRGAAIRIPGTDGGSVQIVLLSGPDSLALWKGPFEGRDRVFLTGAGLLLDGDTARLTSGDRADLSLGIYPAPPGIAGGEPDGVFTRYRPSPPPAVSLSASVAQIHAAGPAREIPIGKISEPVATEPTDSDFKKAAVWRIKLPAGIDMASDPILRIHYVGDVARFTLNGRLLVDDFYNGRAFDLGLRRYAPEIAGGELEIEILPLRRDALSGAKQRIFVADSARPDFGGAEAVAAVEGAEILPSYTVQVAAVSPR